jgi:hypothetical protein
MMNDSLAIGGEVWIWSLEGDTSKRSNLFFSLYVFMHTYVVVQYSGSTCVVAYVPQLLLLTETNPQDSHSDTK